MWKIAARGRHCKDLRSWYKAGQLTNEEKERPLNYAWLHQLLVSRPVDQNVLDSVESAGIKILGAIAGQTHEATFYSLQTGYIGLAHGALEVSDIVAVIFGCSYTAILRPCRDKYRLIAVGYTHDAMDGELLSALKLEDEHIFELY